MPRVILSQEAAADLIRLREFLREKNEDAAKRAASLIAQELRKLAVNPLAYKPIEGVPHQRELIIAFGAAGYVARYRYQLGGDVVVLRIWHQSESRFQSL
jgi:plasmid stabilization system protein ParE